MKVMIIASSQGETKFLIKAMDGAEVEVAAGCPFYSRRRGNTEVLIGVCGVGPVPAAVCATAAISKFNPDCVLVVGTAGGLDPNNDVGTLVIAEDVCFASPAIYGPVLTAQSDSTLVDRLGQAYSQVISEYIQPRPETIAVGKSWTVTTEVTSAETGRDLHSQGYLFVEMEGYAVFAAAARYKVPCGMIRYISDIPGQSDPDRVKQGLGAAALDATVTRFIDNLSQQITA